MSKTADGKKSPLPIIAAIIAIVVLAFVFIGLSPSAQAPGSDRDAHGCVPSEGYTWCQEKGKCLRAWEEGCPSLGNLPAKPAATVPEPSGKIIPLNTAEYDSNGCIRSDGYAWCEQKQRCIKQPDESCPISNGTSNATAGTGSNVAASNASSSTAIVIPDIDVYGCNVPEGYSWCESAQKCMNKTEQCSAASPALDVNASSNLNQALISIAQLHCSSASNVSAVSICGIYVKVVDMGSNSTMFYSPTSSYTCTFMSQDENCKLMLGPGYCQEKKIC